MRALVTVHEDFPPRRMLAELVTATSIDRLYTVSGRGAFSLEIANSDAAATATTLREGRTVAIWSTTNLPAYVGHIDTIEEDPDGATIEITGDNLASVLYDRELPLDCSFENQAAGGIAMQLLRLVNSTNPTGIWPSAPTAPGTPIRGSIELSASQLGDALDELAGRTGDEWWLEQTVERNRIEAFLCWGGQRGSDKSHRIHLQEGVHFSQARYLRDALGYAQSVAIIGGAAAVADRTVAVSAHRQPSAYQNRGTVIERASLLHTQTQPLRPSLAREVVEILPLDDDDAVLGDAARTLLEAPLTAAERFDLTINTALDWNQLRPGDIVRVIMPSVGQGGVSRRVRILALQPDEDAGEMDLAVEVVRDA